MKKWSISHWAAQRFKQQGGQKASAVGSLVSYQAMGKPVWTPRRYDALSEEGYKKNVIVYRCVNLIARGAASVPWRLFKGHQEVMTHPLLDLLHCPSPRQAGSAFIEAVLGYLLLAGNSYIEAVSDHQDRVSELYPLRPDRVKVVPGPTGIPLAYQYTVASQTKEIPVDAVGGESSMLHLKLFNPLNDWYGLSPIEVAAASIDQHNAVASHNLSLLQNGGRPSGAFIVRSTQLTPEQRASLRDSLKSHYEGEGNAGRMLFLEGDLDWREMGLSPKDLDFVEGKSMSAREIAQAYNVPPMLVGIPGDATFSNFREARYHLWEDTILPLLDYLTDELNHWLVRQFCPHLRLKYDIDSVSALAPRREDAWAKIAQATFLTINEKRRAVGYEPIADGDRLG